LKKYYLMAGAVALSLLPGVASAQDRIDNVTNFCVAQVKQAFPFFDAYFDHAEHAWHMHRNDTSEYYFEKCLRINDVSVGDSTPE
jgi:hypothetical protein